APSVAQRVGAETDLAPAPPPSLPHPRSGFRILFASPVPGRFATDADSGRMYSCGEAPRPEITAAATSPSLFSGLSIRGSFQCESRPSQFPRRVLTSQDMRKLLSALVIVLASVVSQTHAENWPQFRGPTGQGISTETNLPLEWSQTKNIAWKTEIPGAGWSSPVVWENRVFITAATDEGTACHVMCLDRDSGKVLWDVQVFKQTPSRKETRNSYATPTPVTDGKRVYCFFGEGGGVALGFDGRVAWTYTKDSYYSQHGL